AQDASRPPAAGSFSLGADATWRPAEDLPGAEEQGVRRSRRAEGRAALRSAQEIPAEPGTGGDGVRRPRDAPPPGTRAPGGRQVAGEILRNQAPRGAGRREQALGRRREGWLRHGGLEKGEPVAERDSPEGRAREGRG